MGFFSIFKSKKDKSGNENVNVDVKRGDFNNDLAFLNHLITLESNLLERKLRIFSKKERINTKVTLVSDEEVTQAVQESIMTIISSCSEEYKALLYKYFNKEDALIGYICAILFNYAVDKVSTLNKGEINKQRLISAYSTLMEKNRAKNIPMKEVAQKLQTTDNDSEGLAVSLPDTEEINIPEVL